MNPQTGDITDQGPLASRLASLSAYLLRANVPRMCIFKASQNPKTNNVRQLAPCDRAVRHLWALFSSRSEVDMFYHNRVV